MNPSPTLRPGDQIISTDQVVPRMIVRVDNHDDPNSVYDGFSTVAAFITPPFTGHDLNGYPQKQAIFLFNEGLSEPTLPWYLQQYFVQAASRIRLSDFDVRWRLVGRKTPSSRARVFFVAMASSNPLKVQLPYYDWLDNQRRRAELAYQAALQPVVITDQLPTIDWLDANPQRRLMADWGEERFRLQWIRFPEELKAGMLVGVYKAHVKSRYDKHFRVFKVGLPGRPWERKGRLHVNLIEKGWSSWEYSQRHVVYDLGAEVSRKGNRDTNRRTFALVEA